MDISSVPLDVLIPIFECLASRTPTPESQKYLEDVGNIPMQFPWIDSQTIVSCSHVCTRWRDAMIATPTCWSTIVIDIEQDEDLIAHKIQTYLLRARKRPLRVLVMDDGDITWPIPPTIRLLINNCIQRASLVHAQFENDDFGSFLVEKLSNVPLLETLALQYHHNTFPPQKFLAHGFLQHAPSLQLFHTFGLQYPNPQSTPLKLPAITRCIIDYDSASVVNLDDYSHLLESFSNVTVLILLPQSYSRLLSVGPQVLFSSLKHLETSSSASSSYFHPTQWISAPILSTACLHASSMQLDALHTCVEGLSDELRNSGSSSERFILRGFALESPLASHVRCLQILLEFCFVSTLEFGLCSFRFTSTWSQAWMEGEDYNNWETVLSDDYDGTDDDGGVVPLNEQPETRHDAVVNIDARIEALSKTEDTLPNNVDELNVFMPALREIVFNNCTFTDLKGALDFAFALAYRQKVTKHATTMDFGWRSLEKITFINMDDELTRQFASKLRNCEELAGVTIAFTTIETQPW